MHSVEEVISGLTRFWTRAGCTLLPACEFRIGSGTLHPDVFLRLFDAEPWRAVFLQPVRRPLDGRHGAQAHRQAKHLQIHVVHKPAPDDVLGMFRDSLRGLGLRLRHHDLRYDENVWDLEALALRGLGWQARIDGLGIARISILQRAGGRTLEPVSAEISYGVERLVMVLAELPSADRALWQQDGPHYGSLRLAEERELSRYAFEMADEETIRLGLERRVEEAERCVAAGLPRVAYEGVARCLFDVELLAARGGLAYGARSDWKARLRGVVEAIVVALEGAEAEAVEAEDDVEARRGGP